MTKLRSIDSPSVSNDGVAAAFARMELEAVVLSKLREYASKITNLRDNNLPDTRIAAVLAPVLNADPQMILELMDSVFEHVNSGSTHERSKAKTPPARPLVPAAKIHEALLKVANKHHVRMIRLSDEVMRQDLIALLPGLKDLDKHESNRKIIDACLKRKTGPRVEKIKNQRVIMVPTQRAS